MLNYNTISTISLEENMQDIYLSIFYYLSKINRNAGIYTTPTL